jgi:hypothetical protein
VLDLAADVLILTKLRTEKVYEKKVSAQTLDEVFHISFIGRYDARLQPPSAAMGYRRAL